MFGSRNVEDWLFVIRGEFDELPGLRLTIAQAARRWEIDQHLLVPILEALVRAGVLRALPDGSYTRRTQRAAAR